jgi:hypothetical protein
MTAGKTEALAFVDGLTVIISRAKESEPSANCRTFPSFRFTSRGFTGLILELSFGCILRIDAVVQSC